MEYLKEDTERIFMLRLGTFQLTFAGTILLAFKSPSIMVQGQATVLQEDSGASNLTCRYGISDSYVLWPFPPVSRFARLK